jgi:hypothetical protein
VDHPHLQILALKFEEMVRKLEAKAEMMETPQMEMVEVPLAT